MHPDLPYWTVGPFVLLLAAMAVLPLAAGRFWHRHRNQAIVVGAIAGPLAVYLVGAQIIGGRETIPALLHEIGQYISFIILLASLYTVCGGIVFHGDIAARPLTNAAFLGLGAVLAKGPTVVTFRFSLFFWSATWAAFFRRLATRRCSWASSMECHFFGRCLFGPSG